ncbi:MAG: nitroreductase family protein [Clostridium sp.]|nr:nitroreductase family protein [Clostridium sp.]
MNFFELINKRESVRGYLDKPVEREKIEKIIECARLSPSACNAQPWKFVVVDNKKIVEKISKNLYDPLIGGINKFALTSPVFIVVVGEKRNLTSKIGSVVKNKDYTSMDIGIACENICLAATELGLGTCMMGWFKEKGIKKILEIPDKKEIHLVISLGYHENKEPRKKVRKEINEIFSYNKYE